MKEKLKEITEIKDCFVTSLKSEVAKGVESLDTKEAGEVVDMIKDLAEAEKSCMEACYYCKVVEAMEEEAECEGRMGYHPNRMGKKFRKMSPDMMQQDYMEEYLEDPEQFREEMMMRRGYDGRMGSRGGDRGQSRNSGDSNRGGSDSGYGQSYGRYREAKRYYTATSSPEYKSEMDTYANSHVGETIATIRDIWKDADPNLRKRMKTDFQNLISEMTV